MDAQQMRHPHIKVYGKWWGCDSGSIYGDAVLLKIVMGVLGAAGH